MKTLEGKGIAERAQVSSSSIIAIAALIISTLNAGVAYLAFRSNQENMRVLIERDLFSGLEIVPPEEAIEGIDRMDAAYKASWTISLINTSTTATIPITSFRAYVGQFTGGGNILSSESLAASQDKFIDVKGSRVVFPFVIAPGSLVRLTLIAVVDVSIKAFPGAPPSAVPRPNQGLFKTAGGYRGDPFGNDGGDYIDQFKAAKRTTVAEPCVSVVFETGRGNYFGGTGYWYRRLFYGQRPNSDGEAALYRLSNPACLPPYFNQNQATGDPLV